MIDDFKVKVKNFGAVKDGVFDIKPLTIFIGDNDSGKSYISKMIHIIVKYLAQSPFFYNHNLFNEIDLERYQDTKVVNDIKNIVFSNNGETKVNIDFDDIFIENLKQDINIIFKSTLKKVFEVYFSNNLNDLIHIDESMAKIIISTQFIDYKIIFQRDKEFDFEIIYKNNFEFKLDLTTQYSDIQESSEISFDLTQSLCILKILIVSNQLSNSEYLVQQIIKMSFYITNNIFRLPYSTKYFPANKSGILSNYNTKFQNTFNPANDYIYYDNQIKQDNYIINDFIGLIQNLLNKTIKNDNKILESYKYIINNIDGKITIDKNSKKINYKIGNEDNSIDIPIENISSKVTELTPLILYLKELTISVDKFIIIEEPESHLNPKMQRIIARLLVMMMNEGIQILITTHSDYILNEMDILLKLNHIKEKDEIKFNSFIDDDEYEQLMALDKDNLSVYRFKKYGFDTTIEDIKITKNKVVEKEFEETSENLYLENSKVIEILKSI